MECRHANKDTLEDGSTLICTDCGAVLDEVALSAVEFVETLQAPPAPFQSRGPLIATKIHQKSYNERSRDRLASFLSQMATHFGWSGENEAILSRFDVMIAEQKTDFGRGGDRTMAALYLLTGRQNGLPITLTRMAEFVGEAGSVIGKECMVAMRVFPDLRYTWQTQRFFDMHIQFAVLNDEQEKRRIQLLYNKVSQIMHDSGLDEGRFPEPFALALLAICIDSCRPTSVSSLPYLAEQVGVSTRTTYKRYTEIKKFLLRLAREKLPWGSQVRNGNVLEFLEDIIKIQTELFEPPAFTRATRESEERAALIQRVLDDEGSEGDPEEFIVAYLLSVGYTTDDIMALPRLSFDLIP